MLTAEERRRVFEVAVLETRPAKTSGGETDLGLHDRWRTEALGAGFDAVSLVRDTLHRHRGVVEMPDTVERIIAELSEARSTWRRADVVQHAARHVPAEVGDADAARRWIEATADQVLAHGAVVALSAPEPEPPAVLRRRDGASVFDRHDAARYTTGATLAIEQRVLDHAHQLAADRSVATPEAVDAAIDAAGVDGDQAQAVRTVTQDGDTVICLVGPAGAGKSRTMRAAAQAWQASGIPVRGLAVSAMAAGVLAAEADIPADTVAKLLFEHDRWEGPADWWRLRRGEVVIVDEAGMLASRDLARLAALAEDADAKLVLVGDHAQLGAVEAGGLFRLLADSRAVELTGARRFHAEWERDASLRLRRHDPSVVAVYEEHGRIHDHDRLSALDTAATAWHEAHTAGESIVLCATDNATVDALSERIRAARITAGHVEPGGIAIAEQTVGVGDEIVTLRNDRQLMTTADSWVRNGDRWHVTARHAEGSLTVSHLAGHGRVQLPADYVAEHVALGYALTVHKAQGVTVDRAVVVVDETTTAEALYVGMTRGRHDNAALVITDRLDPEHRDPPTRAADVFTAALKRVSAEQAALDVLRATLAESESLAVLAPRLASIDAQIAREIPPDVSIDLERLANQRTYIERHARPGVLTRAGRDDRRQLRALDERQAELEAKAEHRAAWLDQHADLFAYRRELTAQITARRIALTADALTAQPDHLTQLLGPVPNNDEARDRWATHAGRIEAYREQWNVDPDHLTQRPLDGVQYREWDVAVHTIETSKRLEAMAHHRSLELDRGIERGLSLEL